MGFLDRFRSRRSPTDEQLRRLATIKDPGQRVVLRAAIDRGEHIPEFAWRDLPPVTPGQEEILRGLLPAIDERASQRRMDAQEYLGSMAAYDAADVLQDGASQLNLADYLENEPIDDVQGLE